MSDAILVREAGSLGFDERNARALPLLPILHLAWADSAPHPREIEAIRGILWSRYELGAPGLERVDRWIAAAPSGSELVRGRNLIVALVRRQRGKWVAPQSREELVEVCRVVLRGASSVFGVRRLARFEEEALAELIAAIGPRTGSVWPEVAITAGLGTTESSEDEADPPTDVGRPLLPPRPSLPGRVVVPERRAEGVTLTRLDARVSTTARRGEVVTVGRTRGNTFQILDDGEVSRNHCRVFDREGLWFVEDLGSMNGTRVNGELVSERQLAGDEELLIGNSLYRVVFS